MWKVLSAKEKKKFEQKAKRDKKRFENELDRWTYEHGEDANAAKEASSSSSKGKRSSNKKAAPKKKLPEAVVVEVAWLFKRLKRNLI